MTRLIMLVLFFLAISSPASAAVVLSPTNVEAGETVDLRLTVTAQDQPTTRVELQFTDPSIEQGDAAFLDGWSATLDRDNSDQVSSITWDKGQIPAGQSQTFVVTLSIPANSDRIEMTALQASADGTVLRVPETGESFGLTVSGATVVTTSTTDVTTTTAAPVPEDAESTGSGVGLYLIIFGVIVILVIYVRTKRRVMKNLNDI